MCGIAGILHVNGEPVSTALLRRMTDAIAHRGPDGEGFHVDGFLGLGHRRLAIIDLSPSGHQPMVTPDGLYAIAYNGEVYNFRELRGDLERLGRRFVSGTDTEVVLHAYAEWGVDAVSRFNGMFAFAVWDRTRRELHLFRDRYGIKPLYYGFFGKVFLFGSEQKAILTHPSVKRRIDPETLFEYFTFQNIFTDRTLLQGIHILPAGCRMTVTPGSGSRAAAPTRYWDFNFREPNAAPRGMRECSEELDRLFRQAVKRHLVSDVEIGSYLSGGMDSGSITAIAATQLPYIKTFTCGFDLHSTSGMELGFDEREKAEYMSYLFRTEHYEIVLKAGDMERALPQLAWHLEEPRVGQSYPNFYIAQLAGKFVKVVLSGTGGDEIFGGYPWRYYRAVVNDDFDQYIEKYYAYWQRMVSDQDLRGVFRPVWSQVKNVDTKVIFRNVFREHADKLNRPEDYVNHSLYFESKTFLHGLLTIEDKLSMAHGLETRVPFLDNDLVDFAMRLPAAMKLRNLKEVVRLNENDPRPKSVVYYNKTRDGKRILRRVMERYIPREITHAVKQGFSAPDASWFKGDSIDYVRRILYDDKAALYQYLGRTAVRRLVDEHLSGKRNRRLLIWSLLNFEWWCRRFLG